MFHVVGNLTFKLLSNNTFKLLNKQAFQLIKTHHLTQQMAISTQYEKFVTCLFLFSTIFVVESNSFLPFLDRITMDFDREPKR